MGNIIYKGINSNTITGLLISELPDIVRPERRGDATEVDGMDGDIWRDAGYSSYEKQLEVGLYGDYNIDEIANYFSGDGWIIFSNEPTKKYYARFTRQVNFERLIRFRKAKIPFKVQPYKRLVTESNVTGATSPLTVDNQGYEVSKPTIIIVADADEVVELDVNGVTVLSVTMPPEGTITIDSETLNCFNSNADKNQYVTMAGDFPTLLSGENEVSWSGTVTSVTVIPNSRWL
jgi:phage-related protein